MSGHLFTLADASLLEASALLRRGRRLFAEPAVWVDEEGVPWAAVTGRTATVAVTTLGPGWVWDPAAREAWKEDYEARRAAIAGKDLPEHQAELAALSRRLRLGEQAERLFWTVHQVVLAERRSEVVVADLGLGRVVWGTDTTAWPANWRQAVLKTLETLSWLHVTGDTGPNPVMGRESAVLTLVEDLGRKGCTPCCPESRGPRHGHIKIEIGVGFLGVLELFRKADDGGVRQYEFPLAAKKKGTAPSLTKAGKTGRLVSVYLPARLPAPGSASTLTPTKRDLLQAVVRETTRRRVKDRQRFGEPEPVVGGLVPDYQGRSVVTCPHLDPTRACVGFNGNGKRRGAGYKLCSDHGWMARAGYKLTELETFFADLATLRDRLGIIPVGLWRTTWYTLDELRTLTLTPSGRTQLDRVHLRLYAGADFAATWASAFGWASPGVKAALHPTEDAAVELAGLIEKSNLSRRKFAAEVGYDPALVGRVLRGDRPCPPALLANARAFVAPTPAAPPAPGPPVMAVAPDSGPAGIEPFKMIEIATTYLNRGWSVVPQAAGAKMPLVRWKPYQDERPTPDQLEAWWSGWPDAGIALVLGPVSGLFVIDVDGPEAHQALVERLGAEPVAPKVLSGSAKPAKYHLYFRHPDLPTKAKATPWHPQLEFRGHRGIVIAPPSRHKSGNRYAWAPNRSPDEMVVPEVPQKILKALTPVAKPVPMPPANLTKVVGVNASVRTLEFLSGKWSEGPGWNQKLFSAACDLSGRGLPIEKAEPLLLAGARPWNLGEEDQARRTILSAYSGPRTPGVR